ncbi:MAG TPA: DedA family protein [Tepidisphaeraceae bacterium]|nr:DedA family protein [Tepidisphaeraceae bacterium]
MIPPIPPILAVTIDRVLDLMNRGGIGYAVLFGMLFLCGLGLPVPEDIPLIVSGILIGSGKMHLAIAAPLAWAGIIGGDCVLYMLGRSYGLNITRLPFVGKHLTKARIEKAEKLFERWGIWVVAIGRLFAGIRGAMVVAAGTLRFNFIKFVIADGLAALVSGGLFMFLGYKVGQNIHKIHRYKHWIVLGFVIVGILAVIYFLWRQKRHKTLGEVALDKAKDVAEKTEKPPETVAKKEDMAAPKSDPEKSETPSEISGKK